MPQLYPPFDSSPVLLSSRELGWGTGYSPPSDSEGAEDDVAAVSDIKRGYLPEFKRVDHLFDHHKHCWIERESEDIPVVVTDKESFGEYCFLVYRTFDNSKMMNSSTTIHIKSAFLKQTCQYVMGDVTGVSWNVSTVKLEPTMLLAWLPQLKERLVEIQSAEQPDENNASTVTHLSLLLDFMSSEYASTIEQLGELLPHGEITYSLLWALLLPGTLLYTRCPTTSGPRIVELTQASFDQTGTGMIWTLKCRYINSTGASDKEAARFGYSEMSILLRDFRGASKITSLEAYPLRFYQHQDKLKANLVARGKQWMKLDGMHHTQYDGVAWNRGRRAVINGRVMVDKATFRRLNPNYPIPSVQGWSGDKDGAQASVQKAESQRRRAMASSTHGPPGKENTADPFLAHDLTDDQLMLTSPVLYGFSLFSKEWLEFNVNRVAPIVWNDAAFENLVLPLAQKDLIQSLVEAHTQEDRFDDFIEGKGQGLVFNLYGPPGIGKTMTVEATSECVRRPLFVVKPGELGTDPETLESTLEQAFDIAHIWRAVVLLDEADVYMEQRSVHDLVRNALVAVFLRQLEYYRGILFLTTNRVKTFDAAFQSRIHVSLRFRELSAAVKRQIWIAFLGKVGVKESDLTHGEWQAISSKKVNGREIKNCVRTADSIARIKKETLGFPHLIQVLSIMEQWEKDFHELQAHSE